MNSWTEKQSSFPNSKAMQVILQLNLREMAVMMPRQKWKSLKYNKKQNTSLYNHLKRATKAVIEHNLIKNSKYCHVVFNKSADGEIGSLRSLFKMGLYGSRCRNTQAN